MRHWLLSICAGIAFWALVIWLVVSSVAHHRHEGEASWTLQGEHSHLGCPGQYVETVQADNQTFFLGCFGSKDK